MKQREHALMVIVMTTMMVGMMMMKSAHVGCNGDADAWRVIVV
jgi:hypothetical protein